MKDLFEASTVDEVKTRTMRLQAASERQWGKMNAAQAVAHCSASIEMALGDTSPPQMFVGRIIGRIVKPMALGDNAPMRRNSPTVPSLVVSDERDLEAERSRLCGLIDRFAAAGPPGCTTHPHSFFGRLTPQVGNPDVQASGSSPAAVRGLREERARELIAGFHAQSAAQRRVKSVSPRPV